MIDLARANVRLREATRVYALLLASDADPASIARAGREVDRLSAALSVLAEVAEIV